ncbi:MAG: pyruvate formate lyase family protein [Candidatus Helarchaeota archaeon]
MQKMNTINKRITNLRKRYQLEVPKISIERAKFFTEKWFETENSGLPKNIRVALSMKHVYENMTHYIDPDDRIAGYWTENFLGVPIDIERGVFNTVFKNELNWSSMFFFRIKSILKTFWFLIKKHQILNFFRNLRITKSMGAQPMNLGIKTMMKRKINPYTINPKDKKFLLKKLLPKWKGKTIIEILEKEISKSSLIKGSMKQFSNAMPANNSKQVILISLCSTIATIQGHVILDFKKIVNKGLLKIQEEVKKLIRENSLSKNERDFLLSIDIALEGVIIYAKRLAEKVEKEYNLENDRSKKEILKKILENVKRVPLYPAETFYEAVQSAWTVKTAVELAHPVNLHCFGRMDQIFYPFYKKDIEKGIITSDEARELLEELLLKVMSQNIRPESNTLSNFYHRYLGSTPITLGGVKADGTDATNEQTYLFLEAAKNSRAVTNVSLRVNKNTPDEILLHAAENLYNGCSNISIFNDDINIEAMKKRGFDNDDVYDYAIMGCVEMTSPGRTGFMSANALLLCRLLDMTMRDGDTLTLLGKIKNLGLKTGKLDDFKSFEQFLEAFFKQSDNQIEMIVNLSNLRDEVYAKYLPAPLISAFIEGCLQNKKDVTRGGSKYNLSGISFINSIANLIDSLYVIKKIVFEEKYILFSELLKAIDKNFKGYDQLYHKIMKLKGKWGNGYEEVDELARDITSHLFKETYKYKNFRGGPFVPYIISMTTHTIDGRISIATPDGRKAATPYAASCNPYNIEENGITSVLSSIASLDYKDVMGCAVNVKFHPTAIGTRMESRKKWVSLLRSYFQLGGAQIQPTVISGEILRDAQLHPKKYSGLIVKVGGYSAYFTELGIEIQNEIIERTEHLSC